MKKVNNYKNNERNYTTNTKIKPISHQINIEYFTKTFNIRIFIFHSSCLTIVLEVM